MSAAAPGDALQQGPGRLIVLSGPSGVGKDTVLHEVFRLDPAVRYSVSYTTRPPRPDERDGESYAFVDDETFDRMIAADAFLEWATVYAHRYGTALAPVHDAVRQGHDIVLKIDVQGAASVRRRAGDAAMYIFLLPPSEAELRRRLVDRAADDARSESLRWESAVHELAQQDTYDHRVVNDDVERAAAEIVALIRQDREARAGAPRTEGGER